MLVDAVGLMQPGITACVGAGGKTSLVQSLAAAGLGGPIVITTTTKMFYRQVTDYPLVVNDSYAAGVAQVTHILAEQHQVAWFARQAGEKVIGIPPDWVDSLADALPTAYILVEADGARGCLIKAPSEQEPVMPANTTRTVGIANLTILGQPLSVDTTQRLDLVTCRIKKQPGELITWQDIARLAVHQQGIFQYARGSKVLLLSGSGDKAACQAAKQIAGYVKLANVGIERVVVAAGYGAAMQANEVYVL